MVEGKIRHFKKDSCAAVFFIVRLPIIFLYLFINFFIIGLIKLLSRKIKFASFMFLVYPASLRDVACFEPLWLRKYTPTITIIGSIWSKNVANRGLVVTLPFLIKELRDKIHGKDRLEKIISDIANFCDSLNISVVALAGRLPSVFIENKISINYPLIKGDMGTVYSVIETTKKVVAAELIFTPRTSVAVLGVGFIGRKVLIELKKMGFKVVIGIDPAAKKIKEKIEGVQLTDDCRILSVCEIVIVLSANGDDIRSAIDFIKNGAVLIDDTYPPISRGLLQEINSLRKAKTYRTIIRLNGVNFIPKLPGFDSIWLPGCVIEAMVLSANENGAFIVNQDIFDFKARSMGFEPLLILNR